MDYKNIAMHAKPERSYTRFTWVLVLLTPIFITTLLLVFVPDISISQQVLIILFCLIVLLIIQLVKAFKDNKSHQSDNSELK